MRRTIASVIVLLKKDLKIRESCQFIRESLLGFLTGEYFSYELTAYFYREDSTKPFAITSTEPSQVVTLKKLINALDNAEKALRTIENLDINQNRYHAALVKDVIKISYRAFHEIYGALQIISQSGPDIQNVVSPYLNVLVPQIGQATQRLKQCMPNPSNFNLAKTMASMIKMLPATSLNKANSLENLSHTLFALPNYFEQLQKFLSTDTSAIAQKSMTSREEYQAAMLLQSQKLHDNFEALSSQSGLYLLPSYLSTLRELIGLSSELINTAAPLTKQAYLTAAKSLNKIRHELLPQLIANLEQTEESMGLKSGLLTGPALKQMNNYYTQLATKVDNIAMSAGFLDTAISKIEAYSTFVGILSGTEISVEGSVKIAPIANLTTMMDEHFITRRKENQQNRLSEAQFDSMNTMALDAAECFFKKMATFTPFVYKWSLANIKQSDKEILIAQYKLFQNHFASLYPELDKLIVDTLTRPISASFISSLYYAEYKQLFGENHFKQILTCQKSVVNDIMQTLAQANFKAKLVKNTMTEANDQIPYPTRIFCETPPFKAVPAYVEANQSIGQLHQHGLDLNNQKIKLQEIWIHTHHFFDYLEWKLNHTAIHELNELDKDILCKDYQYLQPYMLSDIFQEKASQLAKMDTHLVECLTSENPIYPVFKSKDLMLMKEALLVSLTGLIEQSQKEAESYFAREKEATVAELQKFPLIRAGAHFEKQPLFEKLHELHLSQTLDDFFTFTLEPYLKNNLSPLIWNKISIDGFKLNATNLPFLELHKDSSYVVIYKQLINSLYHLKQGLQKLESLHDFNNPHYIVFLAISNGWVLDIDAATDDLMAATRNPELKLLLAKAKEALCKATGLPIFKSLVSDVGLPTPPVDVINAWETQLSIVKSALNKSASSATLMPTPLPSPPPLAPVSTTNYLQLIAKQLYEIPEKLQGNSPNIKTDKKIQEFVEGFSELFVGPNSLKKILNTLTEFQIQISTIGKESRHLMMSHLKQIRTEIGAEFILAADTAEFQLGLKPGTLSSTISKKFDDFYATLIENLALKKEQYTLELLVDVSVTETRLAFERKRMARIRSDEQALITKKSLFGCDEEEIVDEIHAMNDGSFEQLINLSHEDFTQPDAQKKFLTVYQNLQPYLVRIDYRFNLVYFLRELQTPEDFTKATQKILALKNELQELILGLSDAKQLKMQLCEERILYFERQLMDERLQSDKQITAFKEKIFNYYVNDPSQYSLDRDLGYYAAAFFSAIQPELIETKEEILNNLSIVDANHQPMDIEKTIADRLNIKAEKIISNHRELKNTYKELHLSLKKINELIEVEERKAQDNPNEASALPYLKAYLISIMNAAPNNVNAINEDIKSFFKQQQINEAQQSFFSKLLYGQNKDAFLFSFFKQKLDKKEPMGEKPDAGPRVW